MFTAPIAIALAATAGTHSPTLQATQSGPPAAPAAPVAATPAPAPTSRMWSLQLNVDFTNQYFYHGILQQNRGVIFQPYARLDLTLFEEGDVKLDAILGTWNSFGENMGTQTADLTRYWYESDLLAGGIVTVGPFSFKGTYSFLTSPSNAYDTVQELDMTLAFDDTALLGAYALHPYAMVGIETGGAAADGNAPAMHNGTYLELGIAPGFNWELGAQAGDYAIAFSFPITAGFSISDYYEDAAGDNDFFGFAQVGAKANIPLPCGDSFGRWSINAGVAGLFLGDNTAAINGGRHAEFIATLGIQVNF